MSCKEVFVWFAVACICSLVLVLFVLASAAIIAIPGRLQDIEKAIKELNRGDRNAKLD